MTKGREGGDMCQHSFMASCKHEKQGEKRGKTFETISKCRQLDLGSRG